MTTHRSRTLQAAVPFPVDIERKFLLISSSLSVMSFPSVTVEIEQMYLTGGRRIRRRVSHGYYAAGVWTPKLSKVYTLTKRSKVYTLTKRRAAGDSYEPEDQITAKEYAELSGQRSVTRCVIRKRRTCWVDYGRYWELDEFQAPNSLKGTLLLELECDNNQSAKIPVLGYIEVAADVTDDERWTNFALAGSALGGSRVGSKDR